MQILFNKLNWELNDFPNELVVLEFIFILYIFNKNKLRWVEFYKGLHV